MRTVWTVKDQNGEVYTIVSMESLGQIFFQGKAYMVPFLIYPSVQVDELQAYIQYAIDHDSNNQK